MNFNRFESQEQLNLRLCQLIANRLKEDISTTGHAVLAVSGGSTPKPVFALLSDADLDWSAVTVTLVDERWVEPVSDASNERLVRENLLQGKAAAASFQPLKLDIDDPEEAVAELDSQLSRLPAPFSVVVLGMGDDGHTASWFPESPQLEQALSSDLSCCATEPVTAPHKRMTLTLQKVLATRSLVLHFTGTRKRQIFDQAVKPGEVSEYPIRAALHQESIDLDVFWAE